MSTRRRAIWWRGPLLGLLLLPGSLLGQSQLPPLVVGVAPCPPFVMSSEGKFSGLAIYLWEQVATLMGADYEFRESNLREMLESIADTKNSRHVDVGVSCLSITAEREKSIDFSHSFYETYTGIAVRDRGFGGILIGFFSSPLVLKGLAIVVGIAGLLGFLFYLLENRENPKLYTTKFGRGRAIEAFIVGLLFATRGPINYYEFRNLTSRAMAALLSVGSTFLVAGITAVLASAFTLASLRSQVTGLQDLKNVRVGALEGSTSSLFLRKNGIIHQTMPDLQMLIDALDRDALDAVVSDEAFLRYEIFKGKESGKYEALAVLPYEFESQNYGFALDKNSELEEMVNRALLTVRDTPEWKSKVAEYLGK